MKYFFVLIFMLLQVRAHPISLKADRFEIKVELKGKQQFKYAYLFGAYYTFIEKKQVSGNNVSFTGSYSTVTEDGAIPNGLLFLSNSEVVPDPREIIKERKFSRKIIFEPNILVSFDSDNNYFDVTAGSYNGINNFFANADYQINHQTDSLDAIINLKNIPEKQKMELLYIKKRDAEVKKDEIFLSLINRYNDSPVSLIYFFNVILFQNVPTDKSQEAYNLLSPELKDSKFGIRVGQLFNELGDWKRIKTKHKLNVGDYLPKFELPDINGTLVSSADKLGKYTLIDFWAVWCIPCMREIPYIKKTLDSYYKKGFRVIGISMDAAKDRYKWVQALKANELNLFANFQTLPAPPV